jgi:class 3 adenylate cyclase
MPPVRRLTAILAADVAGYSRLMGADEEGTHERLQAHLGELVEPKISQHSQHFPALAARAPARERRPKIKGRGRPTRSSAGRSSG